MMSMVTESFLRSKSGSNLPEAFSLNYLVHGDEIPEPEISSNLLDAAPTTSALLDPGSPPSSHPSSSSEPPRTNSSAKPEQLDMLPRLSSTTHTNDITSPGSSGPVTSSHDHDHPDTAVNSSAEPSPSSAHAKPADRPQTPPPSPTAQMYDKLAQDLERLLPSAPKDESHSSGPPSIERPVLRQLNISQVPDSPETGKGDTPRVIARRRTNSSPPPSTRWSAASGEWLTRTAKASPGRWSEADGVGGRPRHRRLHSSDELDVLQSQEPIFLTARPGRGRGARAVSHSRSETPTPDLHSSLGSPFTEPPSAAQSPRRWDPGQVGASPRRAPAKLQVKPPPLSLPSPPDVLEQHGTGVRLSPSSQYSPSSTGGALDQPTSTGSHKTSGRHRHRSHDGGSVYGERSHRPSSMSGEDVLMEVNESLNIEVVQLRKDHRANAQLIDTLQSKVKALETQNNDLLLQLSQANHAVVQKMADSASAPGESSEFSAHRVELLQQAFNSSENRCKVYEGQLQSLHEQLTECKDLLSKERSVSRQLRIHLETAHERQQDLKRQMDICTNKLAEFAEDLQSSESQLVNLKREHSQKADELSKAQKEIVMLKGKLQAATPCGDVATGAMTHRSQGRDTGFATPRGEVGGLDELRRQLHEMREQMSEMNARNLFLNHALYYGRDDRGYPGMPSSRPSSAMPDGVNPFMHPAAHSWAHRNPWALGPSNPHHRVNVSDSYPPAGRSDECYSDPMSYAAPRRPDWGPAYYGPHPPPYFFSDGNNMFDHSYPGDRGSMGSKGRHTKSYSGGSAGSLRGSADGGLGHAHKTYPAGGNGPPGGPHGGYPASQPGYPNNWEREDTASPSDLPPYHPQHTGEYAFSRSVQTWGGNQANGSASDMPQGTCPAQQSSPPTAYTAQHTAPPTSYTAQHTGPSAAYTVQHTAPSASYTAQHTAPPASYTAQHTGPSAVYTAQHTGPAAAYTAQHTGSKSNPRFNSHGPSRSSPDPASLGNTPLPRSHHLSDVHATATSPNSQYDMSVTSPDSNRHSESSHPNTPSFNPYAAPQDPASIYSPSKPATPGGRSTSRDLHLGVRTSQHLHSGTVPSTTHHDPAAPPLTHGSQSQRTNGPFHLAAAARTAPHPTGTPFHPSNAFGNDMAGVAGYGVGTNSPAAAGQSQNGVSQHTGVARTLQLPNQTSAGSAQLEPGSSGSAGKRNGSWDWDTLVRSSQNSAASMGETPHGTSGLNGLSQHGITPNGHSSVVRSKEGLFGEHHAGMRDSGNAALRQSRPMTSPPAAMSPSHRTTHGMDRSSSHQLDSMNPAASPRSSAVRFRDRDSGSAGSKEGNTPSFSSPFGTDVTLQELLAHTKVLEDHLMHLNAEKQQLESEYARLPQTNGRTLAERHRKQQVESRLDAVNAQISNTRLQLRKIGGR